MPLPAVFRLVLDLYARRLGLTFAQFEAYAKGREPWPPGMLEAIVETFEPLGSTKSEDNDTLDTTMQTDLSSPRRGRPLQRRKHPFVAALLREGLTIAEVATDLKANPSTVKAWYKDPKKDPAYRPIPRHHAERLRERLGVPLSAW
jgi:hypothetical protein